MAGEGVMLVPPYAPGDAEEIVALLRSHAKSSEARCLKTADQIEAQVKPPRIPEPGLWGVVEAAGPHYSKILWVRTSLTGHWVTIGGGGSAAWRDLIHPTLIREGVSE